MLDGKKILAVIGAGTMGEAIMRGLLDGNRLAPSQIVATDVRADHLRELARRLGVRTAEHAAAAAKGAAVVLLCVKPQQLHALLEADDMRRACAGKLAVSIAAGVRLAQLAAWLPKTALLRAMPNTPALIGQGMTAIARGPGATDAHVKLALQIFDAVGRAVELDESHMDVVTALSGSGPAFAFLVLDALADGAVKLGLRRDLAVQIAAQMLQGAARMVLETGQHPAALKDQVSTPGGCTVAGLAVLEQGALRSLLARAVEEAARVAGRLGQG